MMTMSVLQCSSRFVLMTIIIIIIKNANVAECQCLAAGHLFFFLLFNWWNL